MSILIELMKKSVAIALSAAIAVPMPKEETTIRVLLMTTGYGGYFHDTVDYVENPEDGTFQILSIERDCGNPVYSGTLEIKETDQGYLLINEVPIETYVKEVVPSEMPSSYESEALKAQAICARTYAYRQRAEKRLAKYGADVDDSVSFQVYNNQEANEKTNQAVEDTKGLIMTYQGEPIDAYFFSTSSGATSTDEVWMEETAPCLKCIVTDYDSKMPWYRWTVTFPLAKIEAHLSESGYKIGSLQEIHILEKSQGGAVIRCEFVGSEGVAKVENEYTIRSLLSPKGLDIFRQDASVVTDFQMLPSAYFSVEEVYEGEQLTGFTFRGGGYGHGVGLSQNGANEMAKQGYSCLDILNYYYDGFEMKNNV